MYNVNIFRKWNVVYFEIWENRNRCNLIKSFEKQPVSPDWQLPRVRSGTAKPTTSRVVQEYLPRFSVFCASRSLLCICLRVHTWLALNSIRPYLITYKWHASRQCARKVTHYYIVRFSKRTAFNRCKFEAVFKIGFAIVQTFRRFAKFCETLSNHQNAPNVRTSLKGLFDLLRYITKQSTE